MRPPAQVNTVHLYSVSFYAFVGSVVGGSIISKYR